MFCVVKNLFDGRARRNNLWQVHELQDVLTDFRSQYAGRERKANHGSSNESTAHGRWYIHEFAWRWHIFTSANFPCMVLHQELHGEGKRFDQGVTFDKALDPSQRREAFEIRGIAYVGRFMKIRKPNLATFMLGLYPE